MCSCMCRVVGIPSQGKTSSTPGKPNAGQTATITTTTHNTQRTNSEQQATVACSQHRAAPYTTLHALHTAPTGHLVRAEDERCDGNAHSNLRGPKAEQPHGRCCGRRSAAEPPRGACFCRRAEGRARKRVLPVLRPGLRGGWGRRDAVLRGLALVWYLPLTIKRERAHCVAYTTRGRLHDRRKDSVRISISIRVGISTRKGGEPQKSKSCIREEEYPRTRIKEREENRRLVSKFNHVPAKHGKREAPPKTEAERNKQHNTYFGTGLG